MLIRNIKIYKYFLQIKSYPIKNIQCVYFAQCLFIEFWKSLAHVNMTKSQLKNYHS